IVEAFKDSSRKDIDKWRKSLTATLSLEDPKFNQFHDLVDDLMTDGHLQSQIQMRKLSTLNTDYRVLNRKTGEENEVLTFTLQQQWFYELLGYALDYLLKGTTLVEFQSFMGEKIEISMIPRRNVV
ncbi:phage portal protein family protein, partial [Elizabethkingia miricola]